MKEDLRIKMDAAEEEDVTVTLTLEDDTELECLVVSIFEAGGHEYAALLPLEQEEDEEGEVYIYRYVEKDGEPDLEYIESDEEYEMASDAFDEMLDASEYDELIDAGAIEE